MSQNTSVEEAYLILLKFLLMSKRRMIEIGAEYGLTAMQITTVFLLDEPRPMNSFTKVFNCDASNVTGLIDGLQQKQLAARYESPSDRRIKMVKLESEGQKLRKDLMKRLSAHDGPLLSKLDNDEKQTFLRLIQKMTNGTAEA